MKVASFDIFDTCLIRTCGEPKNLFDALAWNVLGENADFNQIYDYANIRINAEKKCLEFAHGNEITLKGIYDIADFSGLTNLSKEILIKTELDTEYESLRAVEEIKSKISNFREEGYQIVYISDMYLPSSFLKEILIKENIFKEGDLMFVSCEYNANKKTGSLYEIIKEKLNIKFKDWVHYGDNKLSDVKIPKKKGIRAHLIRNEYSFYQRLIKKNYPIYEGRLPEITAGISRAVYLNGKQNISRLFASDIIALVYVPFIYKILITAKNRGITKLFFIARDGGILYEIAKKFSPFFPEISLRYIYLSRVSLYFPAIEKYEDLYEIIDFNNHKNENPFKIIKNYTGVDLSLIDLSQEDISESSTICEILDNYNVKNIIQKEYQRKYKLILDYFIQEGMAMKDNNKGAIIDLRGTRKSHSKINNILQKEGYQPLDAFYFEVVWDRINPSKNENYYSIIHAERINNVQKGLVACYSIIESYFSAVNHGRTLGYRQEADKVIPVLEDDFQLSLTTSIFNTNLDVIRLWIDAYIANKLFKYNESLLSIGIFIYRIFLQEPNYKYLEPLKDLYVSSSGLEQIKLLKKLSLKEIFFLKSNSDLTWFNASLMYTSKTIAPFIMLMYRILRKSKDNMPIRWSNLVTSIIKHNFYGC